MLQRGIGRCLDERLGCIGRFKFDRKYLATGMALTFATLHFWRAFEELAAFRAGKDPGWRAGDIAASCPVFRDQKNVLAVAALPFGALQAWVAL